MSLLKVLLTVDLEIVSSGATILLNGAIFLQVTNSLVLFLKVLYIIIKRIAIQVLQKLLEYIIMSLTNL